MRISDWSSYVCSSDRPAGLDEGVDGRCLSATGVGSGEGPVATADGDAAQGALGGVVGQADPAIVEEAGERRPALEHVVDGVGRGRLRGQRAAVLAEPGLELDDQRPRALVAGGRAPLGRQTVDVALDLEQSVDRSEEHTSELQSLMRNSYAVFC